MRHLDDSGLVMKAAAQGDRSGDCRRGKQDTHYWPLTRNYTQGPKRAGNEVCKFSTSGRPIGDLFATVIQGLAVSRAMPFWHRAALRAACRLR